MVGVDAIVMGSLGIGEAVLRDVVVGNVVVGEVGLRAVVVGKVVTGGTYKTAVVMCSSVTCWLSMCSVGVVTTGAMSILVIRGEVSGAEVVGTLVFGVSGIDVVEFTVVVSGADMGMDVVEGTVVDDGAILGGICGGTW